MGQDGTATEMSEQPDTILQSEGSLGRGALYVNRPADQILPYALSNGEYCHVLAPRQIGKSSLRLHTIPKLISRGVACASLNLVACYETSAEPWYFGLADIIAGQLDLSIDLQEIWQRQRSEAPAVRWARFLRHEVLEKVSRPVVIFVDGLGAATSLPFAVEDFFASIRDAHDQRRIDPKYKRLTFCLLGSVVPTELVTESNNSPFPIGRAVELEDFSAEEATQLLVALNAFGDRAQAALDAVMYWTEGHPQMTMKLLHHLIRGFSDEQEPVDSRVKEGVIRFYLESHPTMDPSLSHVTQLFSRQRITSPSAQRVLQLYRTIKLDGQVATDDVDADQLALRLSGLAAVRQLEGGRRLVPRNRIYAMIFDESWLHRKEADELIAGALKRWLDSGRRDAYVLRGQGLEDALGWAEGREDVTAEERDFLIAGQVVACREEASLRNEAQALRKVEASRRVAAETLITAQRAKLRLFLAISCLSLVVVLVTVWQGWTFRQSTRAAEDQRLQSVSSMQRMKRGAEAVRALHLVGQAQLARRSSSVRALLLAVESVKESTLPAAGQALRDALAYFDGQRLPTDSAVGISADGRWLVTQGSRAVLLFDLERVGHDVKPERLEGPRRLVSTLAMSPDRRWLVTATPSGAVTLWNAKQRQAPRTIGKPQKGDRDIAISADSQWLVLTNTLDRDPRLLSLKGKSAGRRSLLLEGHAAGIRSAVFSADNRWLITEEMNGRVLLWNLTQSNPSGASHKLAVSNNSPKTLAISSDGAWLATAEGTRPCLWNLRKDQPEQHSICLKPNPGRIRALAIGPQGSQLASADEWAIQVWNTASGISPRRARQLPQKGMVTHLAFGPDGHWLSSANEQGQVRLWHLGRSAHSSRFIPVGRCARGVSRLGVSRGARWLIVVCREEGARLWPLEKTEQASYPIRFHAHAGPVSAMAATSDGRWIVTSDGRTTRRWDLGGAEPKASEEAWTEAVPAKGRGDRDLLVVDTEGTASVKTRHGGHPVALRDQQMDRVTGVAVTERWVASGDAAGTVRFWSMNQDGLARAACTLAGRNLSQQEWQQILPHHSYQPTCVEPVAKRSAAK